MRRRRIKEGAPTLDLHGLTVDDASEALDRYLDHEFFAGSATVWIVTGLGKGALRNLVRETLKSNVLVTRYRELWGRFEVRLACNSRDVSDLEEASA